VKSFKDLSDCVCLVQFYFLEKVIVTYQMFVIVYALSYILSDMGT